MNHIEQWKKFSGEVEKHIKRTINGHYHSNGSEVIDFLLKYFGEDFLYQNIIKYTCRYKVRRNKQDLLKACHYMSILYSNKDLNGFYQKS